MQRAPRVARGLPRGAGRGTVSRGEPTVDAPPPAMSDAGGERTEVPTPVALGLGSNLGDRLGSLRFARRELGRWLQGLCCSGVYETEPLGRADQPRFLNACCVGRTSLPAKEVLDRCRALERTAGREPGAPRWGPRRLDIDLLLYGTEVIDRAGLRVPHPRMAGRAFVLVPLSEVAGEWRHPTSGRTVAELADRISREGVEAFGPDWG